MLDVILNNKQRNIQLSQKHYYKKLFHVSITKTIYGSHKINREELVNISSTEDNRAEKEKQGYLITDQLACLCCVSFERSKHL